MRRVRQDSLHKTFLVAVKSAFVKEVLIEIPPNAEVDSKKDVILDDVTVIIAATTGHTSNEALTKVANNHELPSFILTAFEVA